ncbi:MAG: WD40 repeat domain-containing protein, partial [Acidobacteriota bacterium]
VVALSVGADPGRPIETIDPSTRHAWFAGSAVQLPEAFGPIVETSAFGAVAWSPDGRFFAAGTGSGQIYVVDRHQRRLIARLRYGGGPIRRLSFSTGGLLAAGGKRDHAAVWQPPNPEPIWQHRGSVVAFSPDGEILLHADRHPVAGTDGSTFLTDFAEPRRSTHKILPIASANGIREAHWEPGTGRLALLVESQNVMVRRPDGGLSELGGAEHNFVDIAWAGGRLIAMTQKGRLHHARFGSGWHQWPAITQVGRGSMVWLDGPSLLAVASDGSEISLVDLDLGTVVERIPTRDGAAQQLAHHPTSGTVAIAARQLALWSPIAGPATELPIGLAQPLLASVGSSAAYAATMPARGAMEIWRLDRPFTAPQRVALDCSEPAATRSTPTPIVDRDKVLAVGVSDAGTAAVVARDGRISQIFDLDADGGVPCGGRRWASDHLVGYPEQVAISDDARIVYQSHGATAGRLAGTVEGRQVVEALTLECTVGTYRHTRRMSALALSGDGNTLAIAYDDRPCRGPTTVVIWKGARGEPRERHRASVDRDVRDLAFTTDRQLLILVADGSIRRLDAAGQLTTVGRAPTNRRWTHLWAGGSVRIDERRLSVQDLAGRRRSLHASDATGWAVCTEDACRGETAGQLFIRDRYGALSADWPSRDAPTEPLDAASDRVEPSPLDCHDPGGDHVLVIGELDTAAWIAGRRRADGSIQRVTPVAASSRPSDVPIDADAGSPVLLRENQAPYRRWELRCSRSPMSFSNP